MLGGMNNKCAFYFSEMVLGPAKKEGCFFSVFLSDLFMIEHSCIFFHICSKVLSPRADIGIYSSSKKTKKKIKEEGRDRRDSENNNQSDYRVDEQRDPAAIVITS